MHNEQIPKKFLFLYWFICLSYGVGALYLIGKYQLTGLIVWLPLGSLVVAVLTIKTLKRVFKIEAR